MNYYVSGENVNGRPCRGVVHEVKKGDTLYKISRVYDVKVADLIWMNPGVRIYNLQVGDKICVPVGNWEMPGTDGGNAETLPYVVKAEETLDDILQTFRMTYEELQKMNPDVSPAYTEGTVLNIPSDRILRQSREEQQQMRDM